MRRRWTWALALLLPILGGCGKTTPARDVAVVTEEHRLIEPRLSGGIAAAPCKVVSDGSGEPRCAKLAALGREESLRLQKVRRRVEKDSRPDSLRIYGVLNLLLDWMDPSDPGKQRGSTSRIDLAVHPLKEAAEKAPGKARFLNDLSAAFYVRAQAGSPEDYLRALDAADRALDADDRLAEARFNRALALQALYLPLDAQVAWNQFLVLDPDSPWATEAEARKEALRGRTGPGSQGPAREQAEQVLLPAWAEAWLAGRTADAAQSLSAARGMGETLAEINGDRMVLDAVAAVDALGKRNDRSGLDALARAHLDYAEGYRLYKNQSAEEGAVRLAAAKEAFRRARSPFEGKADLYLAGCQFHGGRLGETLEALARLRLAWDRRLYPSLLGEAEWMESTALSIRGDMAGAARSYRATLADFERLGELHRVATVEGLLAEILDQLGLRREAWSYRYRALRTAPQVRDPLYRASIYQMMADAALREGYPAIALSFWKEVVHQARLSGNDLLLTDALTWRGLLRSRLGDEDGVESDVARARQSLDRRRDEPSRRRSEAMLDLVEGQLRTDSDPEEAIRLLTEALTRFAELDHQPLSLLAYRARARAHRMAGHQRAAEEDLASALQVYERFGRDIRAEEVRLAFLGITEGAFDELISLQALDLREADRAFDSADRSRTRVLPLHLARVRAQKEERQRLLSAEPEPLGLAEVRRRLPPGTILVQYSLLPDRLLVWIVRREGWSFLQKTVSGEELRTRIKRLRSFGSEPWTEQSSKLYGLLLSPWIKEVEEGETLVLIPDKALHSVPFAALRNPDTGRYLVEEHRLAVSPSATLYVRALGRESPSLPAGRGLVIGNPAFDVGVFPLSSLTGAEAEAKAIAGLYPGSADLLTGKRATSHEFLSRVRQYEWIHFAGHSMVNLQNPLLSMLVLAPSAVGDTGAVTAQEIYSMDLGGTRMVVLSACETGASDPEGEGASALARAFLAAGVPTVVASLWKVDDQPTSRLFQAFHQSLRTGSDPVSALRDAQIGLLKGRDTEFQSPEAWAAFEVIGASAH
ncbi:MAG TPA: CHAT domain-containing protein [Thermoanaerobaculia bacterium]|nr:CHAT domain-containing protein [Thermoanaerobaculia bacterium]